MVWYLQFLIYFGLKVSIILSLQCTIGRLQEDLRTFYCCRRYKFATKHCCATLSLFTYLRDPRSSATHRLYSVFPLQQYLRERTAIFRYMYLAYLVVFTTVMCTFIRFICKKWGQLNSTWQGSRCSGPQEMAILIVPGCLIPLVFLTWVWKRLKLP